MAKCVTSAPERITTEAEWMMSEAARIGKYIIGCRARRVGSRVADDANDF